MSRDDYAEGCKLCEQGAKLVLFVTGECRKSCFYCPISDKRGGKDLVWANERLVKTDSDILIEAHRMRALGAGFTGGDPLLKTDRTIRFLELLKAEFGPGFHIHLYTATVVDKSDLKRLAEAGLDEIRFHLINYTKDPNIVLWKSIELAVDIGIPTGIEIPVIPGAEEQITSIAEGLQRVGGRFLNLNELEFSETNWNEMEKRGFNNKGELSYAVQGSEETALKAMKALPEGFTHYCSSSFKDGVQLKNRLKRTATTIARSFESVSDEGLLLKGVIESKTGNRDLIAMKKDLVRRFNIPEDLISLDLEKKRLETSPEIASFLACENRGKGLSYWYVEEYPTADRLETMRMDLSSYSGA